VNDHVLGARVETEPGEILQSMGERLLPGAGQHEVSMGYSNVVRPDVDFCHDQFAPQWHMS